MLVKSLATIIILFSELLLFQMAGLFSPSCQEMGEKKIKEYLLSYKVSEWLGLQYSI